jgi:putative DNA primase/helicase
MASESARKDNFDVIEQQVQETVSNLSESQSEVIESINQGEVGAARLFAKINQGRFVYAHSAGRWFEWQGNFWREDLKRRVMAAVDEIIDLYQDFLEDIRKMRALAENTGDERKLKRFKSLEKDTINRIRAMQSRTSRENLLNLASVDWTIRDSAAIAITGDEWDSKPDLLGCLNGVVDLNTGQSIAGDPRDYIKSVVQTEWLGLEVAAPQWENFLRLIFNGDEDLILYVQRLLGYSISGHTTEHIFPIFWGAGRNGKSTLIEVLQNVLGNGLAGPIQSEMLLDQGKFARSGGPTSDIMALIGKRLVWGSETDEGRSLNTGKLKWLTGGDTLTGRPPYGKHQICFQSTHKLILLTNHRPHAPAGDYALWARIHLIPFTQSFVENPIRENEHAVDPNLPARLKEEASGILAWLVRGNLMWRSRGLNPPEVVRAATENYRAEEDFVQQFLAEQCTINPDQTVRAGDLYVAYSAWAEANGVYRLSKFKFANRLLEQFERSTTGRHRYYIGVGLRSEV